jgi:hypothetical protein
MHDRLIELLKETFEYTRGVCIDFDEAAEINADHLLANGVIVPPCKVGDTVYRISKRYGEWCVLPRTVCSIRYSLDSRGNIAWYLFTTTEDRIGETVFLTREEAEQALKGETHG